MKKIKNYQGFMPTNDHAIFVDQSGYIEERIGIAYYTDEDDFQIEEFIDTHGYCLSPAGDDPFTSVIGKRGDTVTLRQLSVAYELSDEPESVLKNAEKFFTVKTDDLEDTVVLSFDTRVMGDFHARMDVETKTFPNLGTHFFDLTKENYKIEGEEDSCQLDLLLIPVLVAYSDIIGKRVNVEVYFEKWTNVYSDEDELVKYNKEILRYEEMFLPRLRRYINDKLDKAWQEHLDADKKIKAYKEKIKALKERFKSKYDDDPMLM